MSTCEFCQRVYEYDRSKGHGKTQCNSCRTNRRRQTLKIRCVEYLGSHCQVCAYSRCVEALDFHHLDPGTKLFKISGGHSRSWTSIKAELDKCALLCANCHREVEAGYINLP